MGKTLYLSDLDGTLLGPDRVLSPYTIDTIREFTRKGGLFSIATARSQQMARDIMSALDLQIPALLNNGAALYHPAMQKYVRVHQLPQEDVPLILESCRRHEASSYQFAIMGEQIQLYHEEPRCPADHRYLKERGCYYRGLIHQVESLEEAVRPLRPMFSVVYGERELLDRVYADLKGQSGITCSVYVDVYSPEGRYYFMDIFASSASKGIGMRELQQEVGADRVVAFGDNYNDIDMLTGADEAYVTANGVAAAKEVADGVVDSCQDNGVAKYLAEFGTIG